MVPVVIIFRIIFCAWAFMTRLGYVYENLMVNVHMQNSNWSSAASAS